jgi:hypothetical protein
VAGGGWSDETTLHAYATSLAVAQNSDGRLEIAYTTPEGALFHMWQLAPPGDVWTAGAPL